MNSYLFLSIAALVTLFLFDRYQTRSRSWGENPKHKKWF